MKSNELMFHIGRLSTGVGEYYDCVVEFNRKLLSRLDVTTKKEILSFGGYTIAGLSYLIECALEYLRDDSRNDFFYTLNELLEEEEVYWDVIEEHLKYA